MTPADPTLAAFVARMRDHPADDVVRLACADWFEERGEADRAEFVRVQVEYAQLHPHLAEHRSDYCLRCLRGYHLASLLTGRFRVPLNGPTPFADDPWHIMGLAGRQTPRVEWDWHRGWVAEVRCPAADWLAHGDAVCASHPVSKVTLTDHPGRADEKLVGGPPPGAALYSVAGKLVECPRCEGDPAVLFPLRWPGVAFELPPEPPPLTVERIVRGSSPEDVLRPVRELMGRVNDREVMGQPRGSLLHERSECRAVADGVDNYWRVTHTFRLLPPDSTPVRFGAYEFADFAPLFGGNPPAG